MNRDYFVGGQDSKNRWTVGFTANLEGKQTSAGFKVLHRLYNYNAAHELADKLQELWDAGDLA